MPIIAKNISVGAIKLAPTVTAKTSTSLKDIKEHVKKKLEEKAKEEFRKPIVRTEPEPQVTKELPKYIAKEDGILTKKINTKSQYMRDIFELDS